MTAKVRLLGTAHPLGNVSVQCRHQAETARVPGSAVARNVVDDERCGGGITLLMPVAFRSFASLLLTAALVGGCSPKRIAGTDIKDSPETRAVVDTIEQYRVAAESRNADAVMALVSRAYYDNSGTNDPSDDVDAERLKKRIV